MIDIRAVKIIVKSGTKQFGRLLIFEDKFELINAENSKGKSTCINSILYGLGLEELLGDKNQKALKSVLREELIVNDKTYKVDESFVYLEVGNGKETITIKRYIVHKSIKPELIYVFKGALLSNVISEDEVESEFMYVHRSGAAQYEKGFHMYLEKFMGWNIPYVNSFGDKDIKLYIQTIFSSVFIEQVKGWSDFMATVPTYYGIKNVRKRIIEFILDMDVIKNEVKKQRAEEEQKVIKKKWNIMYKQFANELEIHNVLLLGIPNDAGEMNEVDCKAYFIMESKNTISLQEYIDKLFNQLEVMNSKNTPKVSDLHDVNYQRLTVYEDEFDMLNEKKEKVQRECNLEVFKSNSLESRIVSLKTELNNYKEIKKLSNLGAITETSIYKNICPACHQKVSDSLLEFSERENIMTIDQNINYLESEIKMLKVIIRNIEIEINNKRTEFHKIEITIRDLIKKIKYLKAELIEYDECPSESFLIKKINLRTKIELYNDILERFNEIVKSFKKMSDEWSNTEKDLNELPNKLYTDKDEEKIKKLLDYFKLNIIKFGYESKDKNRFTISKEKGYIPTIWGVNIKLDNSSSDYIRAIWAYTLALFQVSSEFNGNHPGIIIFDEPGQQQMKDESIKKLLEKISSIKGLKCIIGTSYSTQKLEEYNKEINFNLNVIKDKAIN